MHPDCARCAVSRHRPWGGWATFYIMLLIAPPQLLLIMARALKDQGVVAAALRVEDERARDEARNDFTLGIALLSWSSYALLMLLGRYRCSGCSAARGDH